MTLRSPQIFVLMAVVMACSATIAFADQIAVGLLAYDQISADQTQTQFDILNLTGDDAGLGFPITSDLTFNITSLVVNFTGGASATFTGSEFTVEDPEDDVDCDLTVTPACNLNGDSITSAVLTGTFSPTTGLSGLPAGDTGIEAGFSETITPSSGSTLIAGADSATIYATGTGTPALPEPGAWELVIALCALALVWRAVPCCWRRVRRAAA